MKKTFRIGIETTLSDCQIENLIERIYDRLYDAGHAIGTLADVRAVSPRVWRVLYRLHLQQAAN